MRNSKCQLDESIEQCVTETENQFPAMPKAEWFISSGHTIRLRDDTHIPTSLLTTEKSKVEFTVSL